MNPRRYMVVDVFTGRPFTGNPAAVMLDTEGLSEAAMQRIAAEFNLSETTFIAPPEDAAVVDVRFRWFTPAVEVAMCGHATIAGVHALLKTQRLARMVRREDGVLRIQTRSGVLEAVVEPARLGGGDHHVIWIELPRPALTPFNLSPKLLSEGFRLRAEDLDADFAPMLTQDRDAVFFVKTFQALQEIRPDFARLVELGRATDVRGFCVGTTNTLAPSVQAHSRFFAPAVGIGEDPVTGSVHGPLLAYLVHHRRVAVHDGLAVAQCTQGIPGGRQGLVRVLGRVEDGRVVSVQIGGEATTVMQGELCAE